MLFLAQELREYMAKLGFRTVDEMVGRTDMLKVKAGKPEKKRRNKVRDLRAVLDNPYASAKVKRGFIPAETFDFGLKHTKDENGSLSETETGARKRRAGPGWSFPWTMWTALSAHCFGSKITRLYGNTLPDDTFHIKCTGSRRAELRRLYPEGADAGAVRRQQ